MRTLLENDFPAHYGVGRRRQCAEVQTSDVVFDLQEQPTNFVVAYRSGEASFSNEKKNLLSVINYEQYLNRFNGTRMSDGKRRCDFIVSSVDNDVLLLLCEMTSSLDGVENLSLPIMDHNGNVKFPRGKYEKAEVQLFQSLDNILAVPTIAAYAANKQKRICLMSYVITHSAEHNAVEAFGRPRMTEAKEAGEDGAEVSCPAIEAFGFRYFRISHDYTFKL